MFPKNTTLSSICTDLTLEKARRDLEKESGAVIKKNAPLPSGGINTTNEVEYINKETELKDGSIDSMSSDEKEIKKWREKRLQELKEKKELKKDGVYLEIIEKDFLPTVLKNYCVVCHFYEKNFNRCEILDKHLIRLANIHLTTKFIKIEANSCLFFINKLKIRVLPSLGLFIGGVLVHTSVGFEDFGNKDDFTTKQLETFLYQKKLLTAMEYSEDEEEPLDDN